MSFLLTRHSFCDYFLCISSTDSEGYDIGVFKEGVGVKGIMETARMLFCITLFYQNAGLCMSIEQKRVTEAIAVDIVLEATIIFRVLGRRYLEQAARRGKRGRYYDAY